MNERMFSLGARLEACADFVRKGRVVADIGTDHAYLPIWLALTEKVSRAYASDINDEPIKVARENIERYNLNDKIITFTGAGLEKIPPDDVDDVVIAGMGSDNIVGILDAAKWLKSRRYRLILQPMSRVEKLREYLYRNNFDIVNEKAICEANRIYTVVCAEYSDAAIDFSEFNFYAGGLSNKDECSRKLLKKQASVLLSEAEGHAKRGDFKGEQRLKKTAGELMDYVNEGEN
ncbi:MAG: class I SAM-dependent methyltransferase [Acutalibacteraceae bacterium]